MLVTGTDDQLRRRYFALSEEELFASLEYLYRVATTEVFRYTDKSKVKELAVLKEGVLFLKSRILDEQTLKAIGGLEDMVDVDCFAGLSFNVLLIYRHSPMAISIANHLHYDVFQHKGLESY